MEESAVLKESRITYEFWKSAICPYESVNYLDTLVKSFVRRPRRTEKIHQGSRPGKAGDEQIEKTIFVHRMFSGTNSSNIDEYLSVLDDSM